MPEQRIREIVREEIQKAFSFGGMEFSIQETIKARIGAISLSLSPKGVDTEDVTINEAGAATHTVLNDPAGFLLFKNEGTERHIPFFSS